MLAEHCTEVLRFVSINQLFYVRIKYIPYFFITCILWSFKNIYVYEDTNFIFEVGIVRASVGRRNIIKSKGIIDKIC